MSILKNIGRGFKQSIQLRRIGLYILLVQLFLTVMAGVLTFNYIQSSIGQTTNLLKIIDGYNHDVFQDLLRFESTGWEMIKTFTTAIIILYIFLGPFIMGGILHAFQIKKDCWETFWNGGSRFYLDFLKLNLIFLSIFSIVAIILTVIGFYFSNYGLDNFLTEIPVLIIIVLLAFLFLLFGIILVSISTRAKWLIMTLNYRPWPAFVAAYRQVHKRSFAYILLGLAFLFISGIFAITINMGINYIEESSLFLILLALLFQVFALYVRVLLRNAYYSSILSTQRFDS